MIRKFFCLALVFVCLVSQANAQEPFVLELRETGNYSFGQGVLEGYFLTALNRTSLKVVPGNNYSYNSNDQKPKIRVSVNLNNQDASVSGSSNFFNTSSHSTNTRIHSTLSITATLTSGNWCESVTTVVSDSVAFTEHSQTNINIKNYNFSLPVANSREQKRLELNNRLLAIALIGLMQKLNNINPPASSELIADAPFQRMKIRLPQEYAQKYINLGYVEVLRNNSVVRYRIVQSEGNVFTLEFRGEPIRSNDTLK